MAPKHSLKSMALWAEPTVICTISPEFPLKNDPASFKVSDFDSWDIFSSPEVPEIQLVSSLWRMGTLGSFFAQAAWSVFSLALRDRQAERQDELSLTLSFCSIEAFSGWYFWMRLTSDW